MITVMETPKTIDEMFNFFARFMKRGVMFKEAPLSPKFSKHFITNRHSVVISRETIFKQERVFIYFLPDLSIPKDFPKHDPIGFYMLFVS